MAQVIGAVQISGVTVGYDPLVWALIVYAVSLSPEDFVPTQPSLCLQVYSLGVAVIPTRWPL